LRHFVNLSNLVAKKIKRPRRSCLLAVAGVVPQTQCWRVSKGSTWSTTWHPWAR